MLLLLDWDETLTSHDTLSLIAPPAGTQSCGPSFSSYSSSYASDLATYKSQHALPTTLDGQLRWQSGLDEVELKSQSRIEQGGLFKGVKGEEVRRRAELVELRKGVTELAEWAKKNAHRTEVHIISVGWSARFIQASLSHHLSWQPNSIHANEIQTDSKDMGTGRLTKSSSVTSSSGGIRISTHKAAEASCIELQARRDRSLKGLTVFAGDSATDLEAMLGADVGIVLGDATGIKEVLQRTGGADWLVEMGAWMRERVEGTTKARLHTFVRVDDWLEGLRVLHELDQ